MKIPFSPPDITDQEIEEVSKTLKSGWITTGPKTKLFEKKIAEYCGTKKAVALNSATVGLELVLRILGVGAGDEVITSAYTYTASASVINHVGAKIVFCDVQKDSYFMDYDKLESLINEKTKVIIPVDIGGQLCDYKKIFEIVKRKKNLFKPNGFWQEQINRIAVLADAAHSFGAEKDGIKSGNFADFTSFSFHAVKNLTTAEGGAVTWNLPFDDEKLYKEFMLWSLQGQNKDALAKTKLGAWEYDIEVPGYKCNMTDVLASLGLVQLERYAGLLKRRREIYRLYKENLQNFVELSSHENSSYHLLLTRIKGMDEKGRNKIIENMAEQGVALNVHYKPLPLFTAYKNLGFNICDYPNALNQYKNEITLPLHTLLKDEEVLFVCDCLKKELC